MSAVLPEAAVKVAAKCHVPLLYRVELLGTPEEVADVNLGLDKLCESSLKTAM